MGRELAGRLDTRFVLILGKGGVGKTTTAGALALALADAGEDVYLLSVDPAHSLGDLFHTDLSDGAPRPSPCTDRLTLEELDARAWTDAWIRRARAPLVELLDRGTYLDPEDVEGFLDLTLPGADEVAAALRLAELAESGAGRVVVDTAPTGHALRLLRAGDVVASWTRAFDAMEEKARAVIEGLTRRPIRLEARDVVEELEERVERFREALRGEAGAVVVERAGTVVAAETGRLLRSLEELELPIALRLRTGDAPGGERTADPATVTVPFRSDLEGCEGLRRWGEPAAANAGVPDVGSRGEGSGADLVRDLGPDLLLFVGKGGVGKSTCAAAAALLLAERGPVTLLGTDPAGSLHDVLGLDPAAPADGIGPGGRLRVRQVDAEGSFERIRERYRHEVEAAFDALTGGGDAALDRRVVRSLLDLAPPGIDEIFSLLALVEDVREGATTVVDTAPTGHLTRLLSLPGTALGWTRQLLRTVRKYRAVLGLDGFAQQLLDFAKSLKDLNLRLTDPARSAAIVVTQPGPLVAAETGRLLSFLEEGGVPVAAVIRNRWPEGVADALPTDPPAPVLRAAVRPHPPVGATALAEFARGWEVVG